MTNPVTDRWFSEPINNAKLTTIATYYDLVPAFQAMLKAQGGILRNFTGPSARWQNCQRTNATWRCCKSEISNFQTVYLTVMAA